MTEIIVVVTIIAALASLLFPSISKVRKAAASSVCASNNRQIYTGLAAYSNEYQDSIIYDDISGHVGSQIWWERISDNPGPTYTRGVYRGTTWTCPLVETDAPWPRWKYYDRWDAHYALNGALVQSFIYNAGVNTYKGGAPRQFRLGDQRSDLGFLTDAPLQLNNAPGGGYYFAELWNTGGLIPWPFNPAQIDVGVAHLGGVNMGFCDGHVAFVRSLTPTTLGPPR